jgi:poly-gamma-glutamate capsule biosynthesis protein CapA/YwtB (metallophosphatase superfamily)
MVMDVLTDPITLFLCGDVMTGRGIDQALPHPGKPDIYESYIHSALDYVKIAERAHGPIGQPLNYSTLWGDALFEWERTKPDARIVNLETAITTSPHAWMKGINYRMHPANLPCLTTAKIDVCVLANNHVLDWGYDGLAETMHVLGNAGLRITGAGRNQAEAERPAVIQLPGGNRLLIFAFGLPSSGVPAEWAATPDRPGVAYLPDLSEASLRHLIAIIRAVRRPGDLVIVSLHWGGNWGYQISAEQRTFAHHLVDAGVDLIHGHSSHHVKGIEVYNGKLLLYGCGDFLNDYEGIEGYEEFRDDLTLMYFPTLNPHDGRLLSLRLVPLQIHRFSLRYANTADNAWLAATLNAEGRALGTRVIDGGDGLQLQW